MKNLFISAAVFALMFCDLCLASNPTIVVDKATKNVYPWPMLVRRATILKTPAGVALYSNTPVSTPLRIVKFGEPLPEKNIEAKDAKNARERQKLAIKKYAAKKMMCTGDSLLRTFFWEGKAEKYILTIFNAETTGKYTVSAEQASKGVAFTLSPGKYTWTVAPITNTGVEESVMISDSIYVENPFYIENMTQITDENSNKVTLSWEGNSDLYVVYVFEEPTKKIVSALTTKSKIVDAVLPTEGAYSWALMGVNPYGYRNVVCSAIGETINLNEYEDADILEDINPELTRKSINEKDIIYDANDPEAGFNKDLPFYDILGRPVNIYYRGVVVQEGKRFLLWY